MYLFIYYNCKEDDKHKNWFDVSLSWIQLSLHTNKSTETHLISCLTAVTDPDLSNIKIIKSLSLIQFGPIVLTNIYPDKGIEDHFFRSYLRRGGHDFFGPIRRGVNHSKKFRTVVIKFGIKLHRPPIPPAGRLASLCENIVCFAHFWKPHQFFPAFAPEFRRQKVPEHTWCEPPY